MHRADKASNWKLASIGSSPHHGGPKCEVVLIISLGKAEFHPGLSEAASVLENERSKLFSRPVLS